MNTNSILYSLKIWLTSVALAPFIYLFVNCITQKGYYSNTGDYITEQITVYAALVLCSAIFSFFTWIVFIFIIKGIITMFSFFRYIKSVIASVGVLLTGATFAIFLPMAGFDKEIIYMMIVNCICIAGGSLYYNLEIRVEPGTTLLE